MLEVVLANEIRNMIRKVVSQSMQDLIYLSRIIKNDGDRPFFVIDAKAWLEQMRERPVTDIVQHRGGQQRLACCLDFLIGMCSLKMIKHPLHEVHHPECMGKAAVFSAGVCEVAYAELVDPTQPLHFRCGQEFE